MCRKANVVCYSYRKLCFRILKFVSKISILSPEIGVEKLITTYKIWRYEVCRKVHETLASKTLFSDTEFVPRSSFMSSEMCVKKINHEFWNLWRKAHVVRCSSRKSQFRFLKCVLKSSIMSSEMCVKELIEFGVRVENLNFSSQSRLMNF